VKVADGVRVEVQRFAHGRLKVLVRFEKSSNFWCDREITWVPKKSEVSLIAETLEAVDEYNIGKYAKKT
jgi:NTP pyrophosphatase (non-canonical NTP hydrolase)